MVKKVSSGSSTSKRNIRASKSNRSSNKKTTSVVKRSGENEAINYFKEYFSWQVSPKGRIDKLKSIEEEYPKYLKYEKVRKMIVKHLIDEVSKLDGKGYEMYRVNYDDGITFTDFYHYVLKFGNIKDTIKFLKIAMKMEAYDYDKSNIISNVENLIGELAKNEKENKNDINSILDTLFYAAKVSDRLGKWNKLHHYSNDYRALATIEQLVLTDKKLKDKVVKLGKFRDKELKLWCKQEELDYKYYYKHKE